METRAEVDRVATGPVEWRAMWMDALDRRAGSGASMRSIARATASEIQVEALLAVEVARRGEIRISFRARDGFVTEAFTSRYELQTWSPEDELLPRSVESLWEVEERRKGEALRFYCKLRDILTEAAYAGAIKRCDGRELRGRIRAVLLGD